MDIWLSYLSKGICQIDVGIRHLASLSSIFCPPFRNVFRVDAILFDLIQLFPQTLNIWPKTENTWEYLNFVWFEWYVENVCINWMVMMARWVWLEPLFDASAAAAAIVVIILFVL